jgi:hypothetical protein
VRDSGHTSVWEKEVVLLVDYVILSRDTESLMDRGDKGSHDTLGGGTIQDGGIKTVRGRLSILERPQVKHNRTMLLSMMIVGGVCFRCRSQNGLNLL